MTLHALIAPRLFNGETFFENHGLLVPNDIGEIG